MQTEIIVEKFEGIYFKILESYDLASRFMWRLRCVSFKKLIF